MSQVIVVRTKESLETEVPIMTHNPDGTLTRAGAMIEARKKYGDLGMISSSYFTEFPRLVWKTGEFQKTVGRGKTWEEALSRSKESTKENV
jgi:hypothetical protein